MRHPPLAGLQSYLPVLLATSLILAACGGGSNPVTPDDPPPPPPSQRLMLDDFQGNLIQWTGRNGSNNAQIVADPLRASNSVVNFTVPVAAGDMFTHEISVGTHTIFRLSFEYLGLPLAGSTADDHGGFIGIADELPGSHFWLGGTDPNQALVHLIDDGTWHPYSIEFVLADHLELSDGMLRVMVEDGEVFPGVPQDAFFDNIQLEWVQ